MGRHPGLSSSVETKDCTSNYDSDNVDKICINQSLISNNIIELDEQYSHPVVFPVNSNDVSDYCSNSRYYVSDDKVNIFDHCITKYSKYNLSGGEDYTPQEVTQSSGDDVLQGTNECNTNYHRYGGLGFEYDPQFRLANEQSIHLHENLIIYQDNVKPVYVYNHRQEMSFTIMINDQTDVDAMDNAKYDEAGRKDGHGQYLHIFEQEVWFDNQWAKICYIRSTLDPKISGFYICVRDTSGYIQHLVHHSAPILGMLTVINTFDILIGKVRIQNGDNSEHVSNNPTLAYDNYCKDIQTFDRYKCTYEAHITNIIDELMLAADFDPKVEVKQLTQKSTHGEDFQKGIPPTIDTSSNNIANLYDKKSMDKDMVENLVTDYNYPDKKFGYLTQAATDFSFIGPDRETVDISSIDTLLKVADCILSTGVPNYRAARIPIKSGLNVEAWEKHLQDYSDKRVIQYIKFGYPLSLINPHELCNKEVSNHYSACQFPCQVQEYIDKEKQLGALLGPIQDINHNQFHCSPLLTRPKDGDKRRVILNLSYPTGQSVNDHVDKNEFDHTPFILKFPTIDSIAQNISEAGDDVVLFKVDVARAFRNLRVDPANALKFGIKWADAFYVDLAIAFGWTHGSGAFQILSDAIAFIMAKKGVKLHCYIDDYIIVSSKHKALTEFTLLCDLLNELGLPMNESKLTPPTKELTCLGININIDTNTMSIAEDKLQAIYAECVAVNNKNSLSKHAYQSLLGKLVYIQKCVKPSRTFINRILDLFRKNSHLKKI